MKYKSGTMACSNFSWKGCWQKGITNGQQCLRNLVIQFVGKLLRLRMTSSFECGQWETGKQTLNAMEDWLWLTPPQPQLLQQQWCALWWDAGVVPHKEAPLWTTCFATGARRALLSREEETSEPHYVFHGAVAVVITRGLFVHSDVNICYFTSWFLLALGFCPEQVLLWASAAWCVEKCITRNKCRHPRCFYTHDKKNPNCLKICKQLSAHAHSILYSSGSFLVANNILFCICVSSLPCHSLCMKAGLREQEPFFL